VLGYPFQLGLIGFLLWYATRNRLLQWSEVRPAFRGAWSLVKEALPLGLSQVAILLYYNSDVIMLGVWSNDHTVGIYSTAYQMMLMPLLLAGALYTAYFPQLAKKHADPQQSARLSNELLRLLIWMGFPLAALGWAFGRHVIVLLYGVGFSESGPLFEWLSLNLALVFVNNGIGSPLLAWGQQRLHFCITAVAAALNVALNLVLIPHYGAWGAVITTILAEAVVTVVCLIVRRKNVPVVMTPSGWWAVSCATLLAVMLKLLVVWFPRWWWGSLAIGLIAFAACFWWREKEVLLHLPRTRL
jgi:O-antigen/teichoic acid export membrane protein